MKARLPQKPTLAECMAVTNESIKTLFNILTLKTLHEEFGFGTKRLKRFWDALNENYYDIHERASCTDDKNNPHRKDEYTNLFEATVRAVSDLKRDGIDYRDILGPDSILVFVDEKGHQKDIYEFVERFK